MIKQEKKEGKSFDYEQARTSHTCQTLSQNIILNFNTFTQAKADRLYFLNAPKFFHSY